jgi:hypothetical protein
VEIVVDAFEMYFVVAHGLGADEFDTINDHRNFVAFDHLQLCGWLALFTVYDCQGNFAI